MAGMFRQARDEGRQEGISQGRREGIADGERAVLARLPWRRFGPLPRSVGKRLGAASAAELEAWTDNVLDAATLKDVFGDDRPVR